MSKSSITKSGITKTSISKTRISISAISSISNIKDSGFSIGISLSLSFTLLAATWDGSSKIVSADTNVGRVGQTEWSGSNGVPKSGVGGSNPNMSLNSSNCSMSKSGVSKSSISKTSISKSRISKTSISSISKSSSIRISITSIKDGSISLSLWLGVSITLSVKTSGIRITSIGQRSSSTWDSSVKRVHTWSRLATEGICSVGIRMAEAISVASVQECWVSLSFTIDGGDEGRCNNKELIHFVRRYSSDLLDPTDPM